MKTLMIVPVLFAGLSTSRGLPKIYERFILSPLFLGQDSTISVESKYSSFKFRVLLSNNRYTDQVIVEDSFEKAGSYEYTYDNCYTRRNNTLRVEYTITDEYISTTSIQMDIQDPESIVLKDNENIRSDYCFYQLRSNGLWIKSQPIYSFENFDGQYITDYYHKINLEDFKIFVDDKYHRYFKPKVSLIMNNFNNVFGEIEGANDNVVFTLDTKESSGYFSLCLNNHYFVNKETLKMSSNKKDGYVETKYIYLPRNEMKNQDKYNAYFVFEEFGVDRDYVLHSFQIKALKNIIGDCRNSEYCILKEN